MTLRTLNLTRRDLLQRLAISVPVTSLLLMETGCASAAATLEAIITAAGAAVDIAFPQYATLLNPYFNSVTTFVDQATTEIASTDTVTQKSAVIIADAAAIVLPNLSGVSATVVQRIAAIAPLIAKLIAEVQALNAAIVATPGGANAFFAANKGVKPPTAAQLAKIRADNAALKAKLAAKQPKK